MSRSRAVAALSAFLLAGLMAVGLTPASAAPPDRGCTADLVNRLAQNGAQAGREYFSGSRTGLGAAWAYCQFRLYDDNDGDVPDAPEVPHVFSERDWFLGGLLFWLTPADLEQLGLSRPEGVQLQQQINERFYFGESGSTLVELPLRESSYYDFVFDPTEGPVTINQSYHVFRPGSLSPGTYEWGYEQTLPKALEVLFGEPPGTYVYHGVVQIVPG